MARLRRTMSLMRVLRAETLSSSSELLLSATFCRRSVSWSAVTSWEFSRYRAWRSWEPWRDLDTWRERQRDRQGERERQKERQTERGRELYTTLICLRGCGGEVVRGCGSKGGSEGEVVR